MKKLIAATALAALATSGAQAADIAARPYTKAPVLAQVYDWTGFYAGVNVGVGVGRNLGNIAGIPAQLGDQNPSAYIGPIGAIGGAQAGYNWQTGNWVLGLETDIQASGMRDNRFCGLSCGVFGVATIQQKLDWFGTTRARVGLATGPVLSYFTGGVAYGGTQTDFSLSTIPASVGTAKETRVGYTYGGGVEAALGGDWTGKIEYLYVDLGKQSANLILPGVGPVAVGSTENREHIFRVGANYRIGGVAPYAPLRVANWTGWYAGANGGSALARNKTNYVGVAPNNGPFLPTETYNLMPNGFLGGAQAGYNWQAANWVFGLEADIQGSSQRDNRNCMLGCFSVVPAQSVVVDQTMPWLGTVRGRLGYSVGETLFYATGGLAYGEIKNKTTILFQGNIGAQTASHTKAGWTVGGGIETPFELFGLFGKNWTVKNEYLYVDLGRITDPAFITGPGSGSDLTTTISSRVTEHIFRTGINYHFNSAVVAKY